MQTDCGRLSRETGWLESPESLKRSSHPIGAHAVDEPAAEIVSSTQQANIGEHRNPSAARLLLLTSWTNRPNHFNLTTSDSVRNFAGRETPMLRCERKPKVSYRNASSFQTLCQWPLRV